MDIQKSQFSRVAKIFYELAIKVRYIIRSDASRMELKKKFDKLIANLSTVVNFCKLGCWL